MWRWVKKVSNTPICPPAPTVLNRGQFLNECPKEGDRMPWLLAYACMLKNMGEAADGRMWWPSGVCFIPQISLLVDVFIQETGAELVEADIASCWGQPLEEVPSQKDEGPFTEVISCLDELAQHVPTRKAWDELIFLPPPSEPHTLLEQTPGVYYGLHCGPGEHLTSPAVLHQHHYSSVNSSV